MTRRLGAALALAVCLAVGVSATSYMKFEQVTVANSAIGLTATNINGPTHPAALRADCRLETAEVRYTIDGTTPTTTIGTLLEPGDTLVLVGNDVLNYFRAIRTGAVSAVLGCTESGTY